MTQSFVIHSGGRRQVVPITGDGTISWAGYTDLDIVLSKSSAAAITIAAPTAGTDDGVRICVISETAAAHVITSAVDGFNAKGSSGTATFGANKGNACILEAFDGHWYATVLTNVTIA